MLVLLVTVGVRQEPDGQWAPEESMGWEQVGWADVGILYRSRTGGQAAAPLCRGGQVMRPEADVPPSPPPHTLMSHTGAGDGGGSSRHD